LEPSAPTRVDQLPPASGPERRSLAALRATAVRFPPEQPPAVRILPSCTAAAARTLSGRNIVAVIAGPTRPIHPLLAFLLSAPVPLFLGGLLADLGYRASFETQWANFAAWLIAGAMVFTGFALLWAFIALIRVRAASGWPLLCFLLLLAAFVLGLVDSFVHPRDAYGIMPAAPILSAIVTLLVLLAAAAGLFTLRARDPK
jgi:uncharacterized membrane protein